MTIQVACECGRSFAVKDELAGKRVRCPDCGTAVAIPAAGAAAPVKNAVRCQFCHEYVPRSKYEQHVQQHMKLRADGQQTEYATLPPEERDGAEDFANAPRWYRHEKCGAVTGMPEEIIQTYLTNPWFYLADKTFCTGCGRHVRQSECVWEETDENLQEYSDRLRAAKPHLRPGPLKRMLAWALNSFG